jgi:hypothetical protein
MTSILQPSPVTSLLSLTGNSQNMEKATAVVVVLMLKQWNGSSERRVRCLVDNDDGSPCCSSWLACVCRIGRHAREALDRVLPFCKFLWPFERQYSVSKDVRHQDRRLASNVASSASKHTSNKGGFKKKSFAFRRSRRND